MDGLEAVLVEDAAKTDVVEQLGVDVGVETVLGNGSTWLFESIDGGHTGLIGHTGLTAS